MLAVNLSHLATVSAVTRASVLLMLHPFHLLEMDSSREGGTEQYVSMDKKNQLDVTFCILYFSSNSCSTCFGQPCAHHQELTTA